MSSAPVDSPVSPAHAALLTGVAEEYAATVKDVLRVALHGETATQRERAANVLHGLQLPTIPGPAVLAFPSPGALHPADAPGVERDPHDEPPEHIELAPTFLSREDPPLAYVVPELLPERTLALFHGEPRTRKSWAALELAIAVATGTRAFGLDRFRVSCAMPALYSSQEDEARRVRVRARRFLLGRGLDMAPEQLAFSVHAGINLEDPSWQVRLLEDVSRFGFRLVVLDPIRRYSPSVDKGPTEVRAVTAFLRELTSVGATVVIVHHDVKPSAQVQDTRRRGHRASGGDWFASCDAPVALEPAGRDRTLVIPEDFKWSDDPKPFTFSIEEDAAKTWARVTGSDVAADDVGSVALHERISEFLRHNPASSGNAISKGLKASKEGVLKALDQMLEAGRVDSVERSGVRGGKRTEWMLSGGAA